jgi:TrpR-related protein YerC/YecD
MRISEKKMHNALKGQIEKTLAQVIADLKNPEEAITFLSNFFTESELETYAKRLAVAYWLKKGRSYANIKDNLKVSSATIATVQEMIDTEGIKLAMKKMEAEEWASQWAERISKVLPKI